MKANRFTTLYTWQQEAKQGGVCEECNKHFNILDVDHIIPVSILEQLGLFDECRNWEYNLRKVCQYCNRFKGGRIDIRNPKTIELLIECINKIKK